MNARRSGAIVFALLVLAVSMGFAAGAGAREKLSFSIVTGGTGGVWYPLGGAIGGSSGNTFPTPRRPPKPRRQRSTT